jgi:hypothetical protein
MFSRSWALLDGFRRAGTEAFSSAGPMAIVRTGIDGPHVPLPLARAVGVRSGIVGGPTEAPLRGWQYAYATERPRDQRWLLGWLSGVSADETLVRRLAWLSAAASSPGGDLVVLPADIRRRLRNLHSVPDASSMADRRLPRHLLVHIRRAIADAEA